MKKYRGDDRLHLESAPITYQNAKILRKTETDAESLLWYKLRNRKLMGYKFRRQHPIGRFIADFYCHEARLVIELDGNIHDIPEKMEYDEGRSSELEVFDVYVLRFSNNEIRNELKSVLEKISEFLDQRSKNLS